MLGEDFKVAKGIFEMFFDVLKERSRLDMADSRSHGSF